MKRLWPIIFGMMLAVLSVSDAKALITLSISGTCTGGNCNVGVDTISGYFSYDFDAGTVPFFDVTSSADNIVYDAATGGPEIFEGTSSDPPIGFNPTTFTITFVAPGLPASASGGDTFIIGSILEMYGGQDVNVTNHYEGLATVVPLPAALPLFLSALAVLGLIARRRPVRAAAA